MFLLSKFHNINLNNYYSSNNLAQVYSNKFLLIIIKINEIYIK